jgi:hypothetical protein
MIRSDHLRDEWVRPTLKAIDMWSEAAENLLLGTIALESAGGEYLRQWPRGPALGICQVEIATHLDCWVNWLDYLPDVSAKVLRLVPPMYRLPGTDKAPVAPQALVGCPMYCIAIARIKYRRVSEPLPAPTDWPALERYHKRHYNTALGATKPGQFIAAAQRAGLTKGDDRYV